MRRFARRDDGVSMVITAIGLVALTAMGALVLDGGDAYATRRRMQNASDAAALAGARALDQVRFKGAAASTVDAAARSVALANGSTDTSALFDCTVVDKQGAALAPCAATDAVTGWRSPLKLPSAVGVQVHAGTVRQTAFGRVVGKASLPVRTTAGASIQPLMSGDAPFMVCGNEAAGGESPGGPGHGILLPDPTQSPPWRINPLAIGLTFDVHGPQIADCGAQGNSFKGLAEGDFVLPDWLDTSTGVHAGPTRSNVAGSSGCTGTDLDECVILLPVCSTARGQSASDMQMYCVKMASFVVHETAANKHTGTLIGGVNATGGTSGGSDVTGNDVRVVKLFS
jgi:Flp pilus assembly protein TadG